MRRVVTVVVVVLAAVTASAQVTVTPTAPGPWQFTASASALPAPPAAYIAPGFETPPLGIGSAHLVIGSDGNNVAQARNTAFAGTLLADLTALSYSTYVHVDGVGGQAPYLNLLIDQDNNGTVDDQLFFEPNYQTGAYSGDPVPNQGALQVRTWQTWDALVGGWWSLDDMTFGPPLKTLNTYITAFPNARIVNSGINGGLRILTGSGGSAWDNFVGASDNVTVDTASTSPVTYNFEPDPATVITVTTATPDGWNLQTVDDGDATNTAAIDIVPGPAAPPMGVGSLQLAVGADGGDAAQARSTNWDGQLVRDLTWLTYWTYVQQDGSGGQAPYLLLDVDYNNDNVRDDILFFEPLYQGVTFFPSDPQAALVVGSWQDWDALNGGWYSLTGVAGSGPGINVKPLGAILDVHPGAKITGANGGGVRIAAGFGAGAWNNFIGYADAFSISFATPITTYDFEPIPSITIGNVSQNEGTGGATSFAFTLTLSHPVSQSVTVDYTTADGTATAADPDYSPVTVAQTATFAANTTATTITIAVNPDTKFEPNEDFFIDLANPQFATISDPQAEGEILDDDAEPTVTINNVTENESVTPFTFTVTLSNASSLPITVNYTTTADTATAGSDYTAEMSSIIINPGLTTGSITIDVTADTIFEPNERFFVDLTGATNAAIADNRGIGTIVNDDGEPTVTIDDVTENESVTPFTFTVTLSNASSLPITVNYTTTPDTATAGTDYTPEVSSIIINPGLTTGSITIDVTSDTIFEPNETFFVDLTGATNASIADDQGIGTIVNDDGEPTVTIDDVTENESVTPFTFTVTLSNASSLPTTVNYTTAPGTATAGTDYASETSSIIINPGLTTGSITIDVLGDPDFEPNETFFVNLTSAANATIADNQGIGTIVNDDGEAADLSITKTGPATIQPGFEVEYTITATNGGPQQASNVVVTDTIPAGTTFVSAAPSQGTCSGTTTVTCNLGALANGVSATITLTVLAPSAQTVITNTASVDNSPEADPNPANDESAPVATSVAAVAAIPTLSEWALLMLVAALLGLALVKLGA